MVIAVDASGSIGPEELGLFMGEMRSIMETLSPRETWVLWWDTGVNAVEVLEAIIGEEELVISLGGGAADNDPLMKMVKERGTLVYLYLKEAHLLERILRGGIPPFLDEKDVEGSFHRLYERRNRRYSKDCNHLIQLPFDQAKEENVELVLSSLGLKE